MKTINNSRQVFDLMEPLLRGEEQENVVLLFLNKAFVLIGMQWAFLGADDNVTISIRQVCRFALLANASNVVMVHNHPSGNPTPSTSDIKVTENVRKALNSVDITCSDHVIVGDCSYYSFSDMTTTRINNNN